MKEMVNTSIVVLATRPAVVPALFFAVLTIACSERKTKVYDEAGVQVMQQKRQLYFDSAVYPVALRQVRHGDIVFRLGTDITSELFKMMNETDKRYSHCGIVSIENDTVFVYHALGGELTPNHPAQRHTLYQFAHPIGNKAFGIAHARLGTAALNRVVQWAKQQYQQATPFDMQFDYRTDHKLYCTEFVAKALSAGVQQTNWLSLRQRGGKSYVTPDQLYNNSFGDSITHFTY